MRKSSSITLKLTDIIDGSIPTHEGRVGDFSVSLVDIVLDNLRGDDNVPDLNDLKIDEWRINRYGQSVEIKYSWEDRPKIEVEILETVVLEIMEKIYDHRRDLGSRMHLESVVRDVFVDHFEPVED